MSRFAKRRDKLRRKLRRQKLEALLVTSFTNVSYLTGFTGDDSYLLITPQKAILLSDERYTTQLEAECPEITLEIRGPGKKMLSRVVKVVEKLKLKQLGFESMSMTVALRDAIDECLKNVELVAAEGWVEELRMVKDRDEIAQTRVACDIAQRAFQVVRASLTPDMTELQIAADLEYQARRFGGTRLSFPPIVGVGKRAALPHGSPTDVRLDADDFVLIDWGVVANQYMSDLTRILVTGKISAKLRKIYNIVLKAQRAGIEAIRPGVTCATVDKAARSVIEKAGFGKQFGHGLGHGTGLEIHEAPRMARNQETKLESGMIVTVEPGIYLPDWGGVRIEDDILVTKAGHEVLTSVPKELDECVIR